MAGIPSLDLATNSTFQTSVKTGASVGSLPGPLSSSTGGLPTWLAWTLGGVGVLAGVVIIIKVLRG